VCEDTDVRISENKIYGAKMKQKLDEKARERLVRNEEAAGAIPAESIFSLRGSKGLNPYLSFIENKLIDKYLKPHMDTIS